MENNNNDMMNEFKSFEKKFKDMEKQYLDMKKRMEGQAPKKVEKPKRRRRPRYHSPSSFGSLMRTPVMRQRSLFDFDPFGHFFDEDDMSYSSFFHPVEMFPRRRRVTPERRVGVFDMLNDLFDDYEEEKEEKEEKKEKEEVKEKKEELPYEHSSSYFYSQVGDRIHEIKKVNDSVKGFSEVEEKRIKDKGYKIEKCKECGKENEEVKRSFRNMKEDELEKFEAEWKKGFEEKEKVKSIEKKEEEKKKEKGIKE